LRLQQLEAAQQQFGEIDHAFALALRFVRLVELDPLAGEVVEGFDLVRPQLPVPSR
jgi:hypothetical protein